VKIFHRQNRSERPNNGCSTPSLASPPALVDVAFSFLTQILALIRVLDAGSLAGEPGRGTIRAALYTRAANSENAPERLAEQERIVRQWAAQKNYEVVQVYSDIGSGNTDQRPGFQQLLSDARAKEFEVVVVTDLVRLFRSHSLLYHYYFLMHDELKVDVIALNLEVGTR
jgi:hypothetical protein